MIVGNYEMKVGERAVRVLLADWQEHLTPTKLAEQLYSQCRNELTVVDVLVVRPAVDKPVPDVQGLATVMQAVFERVAKLPIYLLTSSDFQHNLSANVHPEVDDVLTSDERTALVGKLRQAELADIAKRTKAIMRAEGATIFRAPSKTYCRRFFRAGNVQMHRGTLDVFFFWMLPWLRNCHAIIADTWTISSIVLNAARLLARYAPEQGRCKVDMLAEYQDGSAEIEDEAEAVLDRLLHNCDGDVLAVFSVCMTGSAVSRLKEITARHTHEGLTFHFGSLYNLEDGLDVECLCELFCEGPKGAYRHLDELPGSVGETRIIDIDRTTYFPSVTVESVVPISHTVATNAKRFFCDYAGSGAFFVHRNSYVSGQKFRHHAIYPDLCVLLRHPLFQDRLGMKLAGLDRPPTLIVSPPHEAGQLLAGFAADFLRSHYGGEIAVFEHLDLNIGRNPSPEEDRLRRILEEMVESISILILDDVSVTGGRLARYQKSLRDLNFRGQVHYLVGVARPESDRAWERRTRDLCYRTGHTLKHTIDRVEFVLLPDWKEDRCPWCLEQSLYRKLVLDRDELPAFLARRSAELEQSHSDQGGFSRIFLIHGDEDTFRLTSNSIFLDKGASHPEIFAAVASAIQRLRVHEDPLSSLARQHYPQLNCLDPGDYLGTTFGDPVLRASILRAAQRVELVRVSGEDEQKRSDAMRGIILNEHTDEHCIALEILLAGALEKLPKMVLSPAESGILRRLKLGSVADALLNLTL